MTRRAMTLLDLAVEIFVGEVFEGGLDWWTARVGEEDGGVDDERMGNLKGGEVRVEGMADEDGIRGQDGLQQTLLDVAKSRGDWSEESAGDA